MCKLRCDIKAQAAVVRTQADRLRDPSSDLAEVAHRRRFVAVVTGIALWLGR